jgi:hypothetical protein
MTDLFKRRTEGTGKEVNKKRLQDFIKGLLFEKSMADLKQFEQTDSGEWPGAAAAIIQTVINAVNTGDFTKLKPALDFAFDRDAVRAGARR